MKEKAILRNVATLRKLVKLLIDSSCWFEVEPYPTGKYIVTTKAEGILPRLLPQVGLTQLALIRG